MANKPRTLTKPLL